MASELDRVHAEWETFGRTDPLWAILTWEGTQNGQWDEEEFFATGREQVRQSFGLLNERGVQVRHGSALDFGCGVGRLTQALGEHFESVTGVDISETMIRLAREKNRHGDAVSYIASRLPKLPVSDASIDFAYSFIVLQHMPNESALGYIKEFARVLRPGGVAMFQAPSHRIDGHLGYAVKRLAQNATPWLYNLYWRLVRKAAATMELHPLHHTVVERTVNGAGLTLRAAVTHPLGAWADYWYVAQKPASS